MHSVFRISVEREKNTGATPGRGAIVDLARLKIMTVRPCRGKTLIAR